MGGVEQRVFEEAVTRIDESHRKLAAELITSQELGGGQASGSGLGAAARAAVVTPYELRQEFTIGNLGWDEPPEVIEARAKELMGLLRIDDSEYEGPVAQRAKGSLAEVWFNDPARGTQARMRCKQLKKSYVNGRTAWLDAKKTMQELQPGRVLRRASTIMRLFEANKPEPRTIEVNLRDMTLSANTVTMLNSRVRPPLFTREGIATFTDDERRQIIDVFNN